MDSERQPLMSHHAEHYGSEVRCRRYRPLTPEEVLSSRQDATWRRARYFLIVMFWAILAMVLSSIACLLIQAPRCPTPMPSVPPVHLNFAPLLPGPDLNDIHPTDDNGGKFELWMT